MTLVKDLLPVLHAGRGLLDAVGLRDFRVFIRITDWTGPARAGEGAKTVTQTELTVGNGARPEVVVLKPATVVINGTDLTSEGYQVTLTPEHVGGGTRPEDISPPVPTGTRREIHYLVFGPGCSETGTVCVQESVDHGSPFRIVMRLRKTGAA